MPPSESNGLLELTDRSESSDDTPISRSNRRKHRSYRTACTIGFLAVCMQFVRSLSSSRVRPVTRSHCRQRGKQPCLMKQLKEKLALRHRHLWREDASQHCSSCVTAKREERRHQTLKEMSIARMSDASAPNTSRRCLGTKEKNGHFRRKCMRCPKVGLEHTI